MPPSPDYPRLSVTGLLLAGGRGSRLGNCDKGLHLFRGRPLAAWVYERLEPQVATVLISANRNLDEYAQFGAPVCRDQINGFAGPLAGIHAGLLQADTEFVLSVACDSPFIPPDLAERLYATLSSQAADIAIAATRETGQSPLQAQPVFALIRRHLAADLGLYLQSGQRKVRLWMGRHRMALCDFPEAQAFINMNTEHELILAEKYDA
ncbi:molybdenum cofactor guanylyltransferase [Undibacterium sp. CY7W]|uniref:Molybdenum cofactor guanylyltransferase n=1 Tax=Undibacterium rugosum TaxID=2762291 RepID=A0A923I3Y3_9BURK|nr:molybdenum cofactor guanylyltransferase MobA [Undibacterium rugosum]MBC3935604.1 molybdenum cofactor guanylyltransferase [Undibacterium rugosum]